MHRPLYKPLFKPFVQTGRRGKPHVQRGDTANVSHQGVLGSGSVQPQGVSRHSAGVSVAAVRSVQQQQASVQSAQVGVGGQRVSQVQSQLIQGLSQARGYRPMSPRVGVQQGVKPRQVGNSHLSHFYNLSQVEKNSPRSRC